MPILRALFGPGGTAGYVSPLITPGETFLPGEMVMEIQPEKKCFSCAAY